jgi:hypothetical protein
VILAAKQCSKTPTSPNCFDNSTFGKNRFFFTRAGEYGHPANNYGFFLRNATLSLGARGGQNVILANLI